MLMIHHGVMKTPWPSPKARGKQNDVRVIQSGFYPTAHISSVSHWRWSSGSAELTEMAEIRRGLHTCLHTSYTGMKCYICHSLNTHIYTLSLTHTHCIHTKSCTAGIFLSSDAERTLTKQDIKPIMFELSSGVLFTVGRMLSCDAWLVKACLTGWIGLSFEVLCHSERDACLLPLTTLANMMSVRPLSQMICLHMMSNITLPPPTHVALVTLWTKP